MSHFNVPDAEVEANKLAQPGTAMHIQVLEALREIQRQTIRAMSDCMDVAARQCEMNAAIEMRASQIDPAILRSTAEALREIAGRIGR